MDKYIVPQGVHIKAGVLHNAVQVLAKKGSNQLPSGYKTKKKNSLY